MAHRSMIVTSKLLRVEPARNPLVRHVAGYVSRRPPIVHWGRAATVYPVSWSFVFWEFLEELAFSTALHGYAPWRGRITITGFCFRSSSIMFGKKCARNSDIDLNVCSGMVTVAPSCNYCTIVYQVVLECSSPCCPNCVGVQATYPCHGMLLDGCIVLGSSSNSRYIRS